MTPRELRTVEASTYAGLAKKVLARRNELGLTQEELAQRIGVRQQTIHRWETGSAAPQRRVWPALEEFLGLERSKLVALIRSAGAATIVELRPGNNELATPDPGVAESARNAMLRRRIVEETVSRYSDGADVDPVVLRAVARAVGLVVDNLSSAPEAR